MENIKNKELYFISEQDGKVEREFKLALADNLSKLKKKIRAYLVRVAYGKNSEEFNIAICFKIEEDNNELLLGETMKTFKKMFGLNEHLDIIFLDHSQEKILRSLCCPFFVSQQYGFPIPDFYLFSTEGYGFDSPIACFKLKKLYGKNPDGYLLCQISPEIPGQKYGLGEKNIAQVVLAIRHANSTLFPIKAWPTYVHIARVLVDEIEAINFIDESCIESIGWGEIYKSKEDIVS